MDTLQNEPSYEDPLCCRACLSTDGRLFNIHEYKLADAFAHITGTLVSEDKLPQHLCAYCGTQLLKSASFRDMCLRTQQSLTLEPLEEKLDFNYINKIRCSSNQFLHLTLTEVKTVDCIDIPRTAVDIKQEPYINTRTIKIPNINIAGVIKKTGSKTEFENKKRVLNIPADKLKYIQKRVKRIENTIKKKIEKANEDDSNDAPTDDNDNDNSITDTKIKTEIEIIDYNVDEGMKELEIEIEANKNEVDNVKTVKTPLKRRQEIKNNTDVKKKRIDLKSLCITKKDEKANVVKAVRSKRVKRKMRNPENNYMPEFDFSKFESAHGVKIVTLTKEEQLEDIASRKKSQNYVDSRFKCEECGRGFNAEAAYTNHLQRHNPSEGAYACEICSLRYKARYRAQVHQDVHRLKFICSKCNYVSRSRCQAQKHHDMHAGKTYQCQHCGKTFEKSTSYFTHLRVVHPTLCTACDECGETFVGDYGLKMHKKRAHAEKAQLFKCPTCAAKFVSVEALNRHTDTAGEHGGLRPCEQCGENCASETALQAHVTDTHPQKTHKCEECDMSFPDAGAYGVHHRRKHLGERPECSTRQARAAYAKRYAARRRDALRSDPTLSEPSKLFVCEQCGAVKKNATYLRYHLLRHQDLRQFACNECPKTFLLKGALTLHMRSHTGERPYQCPECPLAFSLKGNFNRHHKTAHQGIRADAACPACARVFSAKSALALHVNTVHRGLPAPRRDRAATRKKSALKLVD